MSTPQHDPHHSAARARLGRPAVRALAALVAVGAAAGAFVACSDAPIGPGPTRPAMDAEAPIGGAAASRAARGARPVGTRPVGAPPLSAAEEAALVERSLFEGGAPSMRWAAEIHTAALQDWLSHPESERRAGGTLNCGLVEQVLRRRMPAIAKYTGLTDRSLQDAAVRQALDLVKCQAITRHLPTLADAAGTVRRTSEEQVTGSFEPYTPALERAFESPTDPQHVELDVAGTLRAAWAAGVRGADYTVLSSYGGLATSSAYYWHQVDGGGGGGAPPGDGPPALMGDLCGRWCRKGWADVGGAIAGGFGAIQAGVRNPYVVVGISIVSGVAASVNQQ